jgi:hypothetical protein
MKSDKRHDLEKYALILQELKRRKETYPLAFFSPLSYQRGLFESDKHNLIVRGGNRSGKTYACSAFVVRFAMENPKAKVLCGTWSDLSTNVQQVGVYKFLPKDDDLVDYNFSLKQGF